MIERQKYLSMLSSKKDNSHLKVISGIRRCGKTYLLFEIYHKYLNSVGVDDAHIIEVALDDDKNSLYRDPSNLEDFIRKQITGDKKEFYIFIDDINMVKYIYNYNLNSFVIVLQNLMRIKNADIYVTGTNEKNILNSILTAFAGKSDEIMRQAITNGRETLLSKEQMNHDADLHHARAMCAVDEYNRILQDIHKNPEQREFYKNFIRDIFKKYNKPLLEDLDKPYYLRGAGKKLCISQGKSYIFDRVAVLYVSLTILHHFRSDTTVQHYLIK